MLQFVKTTIVAFSLLCLTKLNGQITIDTVALQSVEIFNEKDINSEYLEFSPSFYHDYIMFVKSNTEAEKDENMDDYFLDLSYAAKNNKSKLSKQAFFKPEVNSIRHEGPAAYDAVNRKLYFTRVFVDETRPTKRDSVVRKIYVADENNDFKKPMPLNICSEKYSICHPTLNKRGNMMIFSSDMEKSNKMDLYYSIKSDNDWSEPINLSDSINTIDHEVFPYLFQDSLLFFSSNHSYGLGGFDIYYSSLTDNGWTKPELLPYPINSSFDDIGFLIHPNEIEGYFSSNRPGGKGKDDIYKFETFDRIIKPLSSNRLIPMQFKVLDKLMLKGVEQILINVAELDLSKSLNSSNDIQVVRQGNKNELMIKLNASDNNVTAYSTDSLGSFTHLFQIGKSYIISTQHKGYEDELLIFKVENNKEGLTILLNPKEEEKEIASNEILNTRNSNVNTIPTSVGSVVVFNNIYYNYNSSEIKADAAQELEQLYESMITNPSMKIQLSSHTDCRGISLYNKELSLKRANAAKQYLVTKGISPSRIKTVGFGESRIRNHCIDGINCTEDEHAFNRRTEVLVIE